MSSFYSRYPENKIEFDWKSIFEFGSQESFPSEFDSINQFVTPNNPPVHYSKHKATGQGQSKGKQQANSLPQYHPIDSSHHPPHQRSPLKLSVWRCDKSTIGFLRAIEPVYRSARLGHSSATGWILRRGPFDNDRRPIEGLNWYRFAYWTTEIITNFPLRSVVRGKPTKSCGSLPIYLCFFHQIILIK